MSFTYDYTTQFNPATYSSQLLRRYPDNYFIIHPNKLRYLHILAHYEKCGLSISVSNYCKQVGLPIGTMRWINTYYSLNEWDKQKLRITRIIVESKINDDVEL